MTGVRTNIGVGNIYLGEAEKDDVVVGKLGKYDVIYKLGHCVPSPVQLHEEALGISMEPKRVSKTYEVPPDDPRPNYKEDPKGYQRWYQRQRRRQKKGSGNDNRETNRNGGIPEHHLTIPI